MKKLSICRRIFKHIVFAVFLMGAIFPDPVRAGWQKDEVCQGSCGGGCGPCPESGSSDSSSTPGINIAWGGMTKRATGMIGECNGAPGCIFFRGVVLLPLGLALDAPVFAVKGVIYGLYYGGKGALYAGKGVGHAVAYPFNRPAKASPPATTWEQYKRDILTYQKAVTKHRPSNKDNQQWCKGHIPLSESPNRAAWESRCNPNGSVEHTAAVALPAPVVQAVPAPAAARPIDGSIGATSVSVMNGPVTATEARPSRQTDPGAQLKSAERHSRQAADSNGLAASGEAKQGFDTAGKDSGALVYTPRLQQKPLPEFAAKLPPAAQKDPEVQTSLAWYQHLDRVKDDTTLKIAAVQKAQGMPGADTAVLAAQLGTLTNQMKQHDADQAKAKKTVEERVKHLGLDWQEEGPSK